MSFEFDHLIHYVREPNEAIRLLRQTGLHAVEGGRHEQRGTYNALCYFDLSYIELIGVFDKQLADRNRIPHSLLHTIANASCAEGFVRLAIRTNRIEEDAERYAKQGFEVIGPVQGHRKRPDGSSVQWQQLYLAHPDQRFPLPFLIQWEENDEERRHDLAKRNVISPHPSGIVELSYVALAVLDFQTAADWSRWFGLALGDVVTDESIQAVPDAEAARRESEVLQAGRRRNRIRRAGGTRGRPVYGRFIGRLEARGSASSRRTLPIQHIRRTKKSIQMQGER